MPCYDRERAASLREGDAASGATQWTPKGDGGKTPLCEAASEGHAKCVQVLLQAGGKVGAAGLTPVHGVFT